MTKFVGEVKQDYRGLCLCEPCWNGVHFRKGERGQRICQCNLGLCDCPCSQMKDNQQEVSRNAKAKRLASKAAQQDMSAFGTIEIK